MLRWKLQVLWTSVLKFVPLARPTDSTCSDAVTPRCHGSPDDWLSLLLLHDTDMWTVDDVAHSSRAAAAEYAFFHFL